MYPLLLDGPTARRMLGDIGKTKFYQMCASGEIVRVKLGRKTAVTYDSVAARAKGDS